MSVKLNPKGIKSFVKNIIFGVQNHRLMKLLVIEDEISLQELMTMTLKKEGYVVENAFDYSGAIDKLSGYSYDCILLDITLPGGSGLDILEHIKKSGNRANVIIISARDSIDDKVRGLELGADDYIPHPFSPSELTARVDALYRRVALAEQRAENNFKEELKSGIFTLNLRNRALMKNGKMIELTQVEFQIMEYFFSNPGTALDRTDILNHVWGEAYVGEEKIVDVNIRRLRMKIEEEPSNPAHLQTVWGFGYKWMA